MLLSNHHQWSIAFFFFLNGGTQNKYPFLKVEMVERQKILRLEDKQAHILVG